MPIFISYSRQDLAFVDQLARNLVLAKHHVWMDRWELALGDSITQRIQDALTGANAILVILSKSALESDWCKRELSAGLVRELEEKKVLVMPCVIDDCEIPLFVKDKLYADFHRNPDEAFNLVDRSLARISNTLQDRIEHPKFHTDWAVDWFRGPDDQMIVRWTFIDHGHDWPYVILSHCNAYCDVSLSERLVQAQKAGDHPSVLRKILSSIVESLNSKPLSETITDQFERFVAWPVHVDQIASPLNVVITYRRLGIDNGMDTVVHLDNNLKIALTQMTDKLFDESRSKQHLGY